MKLFKMMLPPLTTFCDPVNEMKLPEVVKSRSRCPVNEMKSLKIIMPPLLAFCGANSYLSYSALCPYQVNAGAVAELVQSPTASTTSLTLVMVGDRPQKITLICSLNPSRPFVARRSRPPAQPLPEGSPHALFSVGVLQISQSRTLLELYEQSSRTLLPLPTSSGRSVWLPTLSTSPLYTAYHLIGAPSAILSLRSAIACHDAVFPPGPFDITSAMSTLRSLLIM